MMSPADATTILTRRAYMLQRRITRHEIEAGKPATFDRLEMRAIRRALMALGCAPDTLPPEPAPMTELVAL